ncbi:MAG: carboxymuconolactone decarboxylase family protein [Candidatus Latescibacteria bacterium]|nr:carboxymuconolactone decarboxylase family protein [Candidatus Latescibacterota bacterium]
MPYIDIIPLKRATGLLKKQYEAALARAGRIWGIVSIMSPNPRSMKVSMDFYKTLMHGPSPLSRGQREMLAVVVSAANHCVY